MYVGIGQYKEVHSIGMNDSKSAFKGLLDLAALSALVQECCTSALNNLMSCCTSLSALEH